MFAPAPKPTPRDPEERRRAQMERARTRVREAAKRYAATRKRKPLRRVNPRRKRERFERAYLSPAYVAFIRWTGCVVRGCNRTPVRACHRKSRGAGGTWRDLFGGCDDHHAEQHAVGNREFERRHGLDLAAVCDRNVMEWMISTKGAP